MTHVTFLPTIHANGPTAQSSPEADALLQLMRTDPRQERASVNAHPVLMRVAQARAEDLGRRNYFSHVNPDGDGPNKLIRQAGYVLPVWYAQDDAANNVESLSAGQPSAQAAWGALMQSPSHSAHLLGLGPMYVAQVCVGGGYFRSAKSHYVHYWVAISAPVMDQ